MNARNLEILMQRVSVVILTHNRSAELCRTLEKLLALPVPPAIVVVDNGSKDDTSLLVRRHFPKVKLVTLPRNIGAAARNTGVKLAKTPYVAFCDDDTWWGSGSLEQAVALLESCPEAAVLCARVLVGPEQKEDPTCTEMAASPLPKQGLPGPALMGFLAGAAVMRRQAFLDVGGYEPKLFIGGEEALLTLDLVSRGWRLAYVPQLTVHHYPSPDRNQGYRRTLLLRNAIWIAWMRLPASLAWHETLRILHKAWRERALPRGLAQTLIGLPWALKRRKVVPPEVARLYSEVHK